MSDAVDLAAVMHRHAAFRPRSPICPNPALPRAAAVESAQDAYDRGVADGQALAADSHASERQALLKLVAGAEALQVQPCPQLAHLITHAVEQLVVQIVGASPVNPAWLNQRVAEACAVIADADSDCILYLNPADIAIIGTSDLGLPVRSDPRLARGGLRVDAGDGWVEHGRPVYLDALSTALGRTALGSLSSDYGSGAR